MTWQPIETAPKDGQPILLSRPMAPLGDDDYAVFICVAYESNGHWFRDKDSELVSFTPTHWMPLPDPPKAEGER